MHFLIFEVRIWIFGLHGKRGENSLTIFSLSNFILTLQQFLVQLVMTILNIFFLDISFKDRLAKLYFCCQLGIVLVLWFFTFELRYILSIINAWDFCTKIVPLLILCIFRLMLKLKDFLGHGKFYSSVVRQWQIFVKLLSYGLACLINCFVKYWILFVVC